MNRAQIMIIFVVAFFVAVFAQGGTTTVAVQVNTATSPPFTGVTETTAVKATTVTDAPDPNTTLSTSSPVEPTTSGNRSESTTAVINTTTIGPTEAPMTTPPITTVSNATTVTTATATSTASVEPMTTSDAPCVPSGFDGASFIGGIVLALGVIVILVIVVKCYNHQSRKNELHYSQF